MLLATPRERRKTAYVARTLIVYYIAYFVTDVLMNCSALEGNHIEGLRQKPFYISKHDRNATQGEKSHPHQPS